MVHITIGDDDDYLCEDGYTYVDGYHPVFVNLDPVQFLSVGSAEVHWHVQLSGDELHYYPCIVVKLSAEQD